LNKVLPFNYPAITSYPEHAFFHSGLSHHKDFETYLYSNYIQLSVQWNRRINFDYVDLMDTRTPLMEIQRLPKRNLENFGIGIINFIVTSIDNGYYYYAYVNEYHIPGSPAYQKYSFSHMILVYGYDLEGKTLNIAGFLENRKFMASKVSFLEFEKAYQELDDTGSFSYMKILDFYTINENGKYGFDVKWVIEQLKDYFYSKNTSERYRAIRNPIQTYYGLEVFTFLKKCLYEASENDYKLHRESYHVLLDHKKCMHDRVRYLFANQYINDESICDRYADLVNDTMILRNLMLKYNIKKDKSLIEKIANKIDSIVMNERDVLEQLISALENGVSTDLI
jgi:hypothetical protein